MAIDLYELVGSDPERPFSPHCWKVAFALAHKGLEFNRVPTPFTAVPSILGGGHKLIPVLVDEETVVSDSFAIAQYLERTYPDRPSLFGGEGGEAAARFVERWAAVSVGAPLVRMIVADIHGILDPVDQAYFRKSREARFGSVLEQVPTGREDRLPAFRAGLEPLRSMLGVQAFIGGSQPNFSDYIVAGTFQWARVVSAFHILEDDDPVADWFERCLDLHHGLGRRVPAAA